MAMVLISLHGDPHAPPKTAYTPLDGDKAMYGTAPAKRTIKLQTWEAMKNIIEKGHVVLFESIDSYVQCLSCDLNSTTMEKCFTITSSDAALANKTALALKPLGLKVLGINIRQG